MSLVLFVAGKPHLHSKPFNAIDWIKEFKKHLGSVRRFGEHYNQMARISIIRGAIVVHLETAVSIWDSPLMCKQAVEHDPHYLRFVNNVTAELATLAFSRDVETFRYFPDVLKNEEVCVEAIKGNYFNITFCPVVTKKMMVAFIKKSGGKEMHLMRSTYGEDFVREVADYITYEFADVLRFCEETGSKMRKFVMQFPRSFESYTGDQDSQLVERCIAFDPFLLKFVKNMSSKHALLAVAKNPQTLQFVPAEIQQRYPEIVRMALKEDPRYIRYSKLEHGEEDIKKAIELGGGDFIAHINNKTSENCKLAVSMNPASIRFIPEELVDYEMCVAAVKANPDNLEYVPVKFIDVKIAQYAHRGIRGKRRIPDHVNWKNPLSPEYRYENKMNVRV